MHDATNSQVHTDNDFDILCSDIDVPETCKDISGGQELSLVANASTVHWGYFFNGVEPNLVASSGDIIDIEMITHHAGDDYDKMIKGDPGVEDIYKVRQLAIHCWCMCFLLGY